MTGTHIYIRIHKVLLYPLVIYIDHSEQLILTVLLSVIRNTVLAYARYAAQDMCGLGDGRNTLYTVF